jgi:16S rRNA (cytidine1402-2'-O)-methyltransferase
VKPGAGGSLYLLPAPLAPYSPEAWEASRLALELPGRALSLYASLRHFVVESERTAMRLLSRFRDRQQMEALDLQILDEHSEPGEIPALLAPVRAGEDCGFFSEAGMPCIADPGAALVAAAHEAGVPVVPVSGPSSISMALVASGLDAQRFAFLGYLPQEHGARIAAIRNLAAEIARDGMTRIFIETPYRNQVMLADLAATLPPGMQLCIASDICGPSQRILSARAGQWNTAIGAEATPGRPDARLSSPGKVPAVFLVGYPARLASASRFAKTVNLRSGKPAFP